MFLCLREDLKEKSVRLKDFCLPESPLYFLFFSSFKRAQTNSYVKPLHLYLTISEKKFTVRCIIFSLRTDIGKQTIPFFATNNNSQSFTTSINVNRATYNLFIKIKKKDKHGLEKPTSLSILELKRILSFIG